MALIAAPAGAAPTADFDWAPQNPLPGQVVTFTAQEHPQTVAWGWDLNNDGDFTDQAGRQIAHSYGAPGKFAVWVRAFDDTGATDDLKRTIEVVSPSTN